MVELTDNHCRITATKFPSDRYCTIYYLFFKVTFKRRLTAYVFRDKVSRSGSNVCQNRLGLYGKPLMMDGFLFLFPSYFIGP